MKPLKIGLVFDDSLDKPDGVQQYVLAIGAWLSTQGHEVHYLVGRTIRKDIRNIHNLSRNISVRFNGNRLSMPLPASRDTLRSLLVTEKFDILHVQVPYSPFLAKRIIYLAPPSTAIIGTFHILPNSKLATAGNYLLGLWLKRSLKRFDAMVSVSTAAAGFAKRVYGISAAVLPNVVDYNRFHNAKVLKKYDNSMSTILFVGRLVPRKGCLVLLQAVDYLLHSGLYKDVPQFQVVIGGKGPLEQQLKRYTRQHDLERLVEFTGFVNEEEKPGLYAASSISVFPSFGGESFGIVLLEAMAGGTATVLAGNNPGYASVMAPKPELLFDPRHPEQLAQKLWELLTNEAGRQELAAWGATYTRDFDTAAVGNQLLETYKQALHSRRNLP